MDHNQEARVSNRVNEESLIEYMRLLRYNNLILRILGFEPYTSKAPRRWLPHIPNIMIIILAYGGFMGFVEHCLMLKTADGTLQKLLHSATVIISQLLSEIKMAILINKRSLLDRYLIEFLRKWQESWKSPRNRSDMIGTAKFCNTMIFFYYIFILLTTVNYIVTPMVNKILGTGVNGGENGSTKIFPTPARYPWSYEYYEITYFIHSVGALYACHIIVGFDAIYCTFVAHTCIQFKILQLEMSNFKSDIKLKKSVSNDAIYSMITEFTKHHNNILRYVEDLQSLFGSILFIEFLSSATLIALVTFQMKMSSADSILSFFTFIFYFSFVLLHMFMYCTFGTMLTNQSHLIVSACWNGSLWDDDLSERCRKSLLTIMIRATKPCYLIGGKCFTAGLEQFTMIIKSAVSYYALINTFLE